MDRRLALQRTLAADIDLFVHRRTALRARLQAVVATLDQSPPAQLSTHDLLDTVLALVDSHRADHLWLLTAVVSGAVPTVEQVQAAHRRARLDGVLPILARLIHRAPSAVRSPLGRWPTVGVVTGTVLVDVTETSCTDVATGIQRVTRETVRRWSRNNDLLLVGWNRRSTALRIISDKSAASMLGGNLSRRAGVVPGQIVIPWQATYILPELATEPRRNASIRSLLTYSGARGGMIGFDCVPVSTAETIGEGMGGGFAHMLASAALMNHVATISQAAGTEYEGWRQMLIGTGLPGPTITPVSLASSAVRATPAMAKAADAAIGSPHHPVVLAVGSHEPRKNHLALLCAAEMLWREGLGFELVFVGGRAWRNERFERMTRQLQAAGRSVQMLTGVSDDLLWGLYRRATVVAFPSLNEGYGLPITEALCNGTPVITSNFGSMAEIAAAGGCELLDPRDDTSIAAALRRLLLDQRRYAELVGQASARTEVSWDEYARQTWAVLTGSGTTERAAIGA